VTTLVIAGNGEPWWISLIKAAIIINIVLVTFAYLTLAERKVMGRMQLRYGPNRAGPFGLLQPIADLVKLVRKEAFSPSSAIATSTPGNARPTVPSLFAPSRFVAMTGELSVKP
jgi:NADH-quinone oxidoreductase subunit H